MGGRLSPLPVLYTKIGIGGLCTAAALAYGALLLASPLPFGVMDQDHSGLVSPGEALNALDTGQRDSTSQAGCIEFFWLKDGASAYTRCPAAN